MKKLILLGIILAGQAAWADMAQLTIARDELDVSLESHSNIGPTYQHEPKAATTGIRYVGVTK